MISPSERRPRSRLIRGESAVMEASHYTVAQKIFNFADDVDPTGERTIGVLTKCDLVPTTDPDALEEVCYIPCS